jgi:hypothetical protein
MTALASATGELAYPQSRHFLNPRRTTASLTQSQSVIRRKTPTPALAAPTPRSPNRDLAKAGLITPLVVLGYSAELILANRAYRRRQISLFLTRFFQRHALQLLSFLEYLLLQMPHVLITRIDNPD